MIKKYEKIRFAPTLLGCLLLCVSACAGESLFQPIGNNLSGPISIVFDTDQSRAYVVNSNLNVAYSDTSIVILDISDPIAPVFLDNTNNPISIKDLSGQAFLDATTDRLFVTNRFSPHKNDIIDDLLVINVDEGSDLGTQQAFEAGENPFGMACCDANDFFYVVSDATLEVFPLSDPSQKISRSLEVILSDGSSFNGFSTTHIALLGNQAFLSNRAGVIYVINLDNVEDTDKNPIDYLITNLHELKSIATDGINIYVDEVDFEDGDVTRFRSIDPATVPPIADNEGTIISVDIDDTREVTLPDNSTEDRTVEKQILSLGSDPQDILVFKSKAYVSDLEDNTITVIDISDPDNISVETTIALNANGFTSDAPYGMTAATFGTMDLLYVGNLDSNNISIIDIGTNSVIATYP